MSNALETTGLSKRYGRSWALQDCTLTVPAGRVAALVGPNGAGKTTLLHLAVGLLEPTTGDVQVFGLSPRRQPKEALPRLGFVAQDTPLYKGFKVAELLKLGRKLNPRWLTVKLALVLVAGLLAAGVMLAVLIWWRSPSTQFMGSFSNSAFDTSGPVWVGAMLLALALGVFAGTLTRRVVFAIFLTIALFVAIRAPVELLLRPNFEPPITVMWPLGTASKPITLSGQDWLIATGYIDAQGNKTNRFACSADKSLDQCAQADGLTGHYLTYQPADRFWAFQWIETGIYLAFSALALSATVWLVRRRLS